MPKISVIVGSKNNILKIKDLIKTQKNFNIYLDLKILLAQYY